MCDLENLMNEEAIALIELQRQKKKSHKLSSPRYPFLMAMQRSHTNAVRVRSHDIFFFPVLVLHFVIRKLS